MRLLVAYASRHGATQGIAERIATTLERHDLAVTFKPFHAVGDVSEFDAFVLGSSAYMGQWERDAANFVRNHASVLAHRPVWLFSSGPIGTETIDKQGHDVLEASRPREFEEFAGLIHPRDERVFFGAYDPNRKDAGFIERLVVKMPAIRDAMPIGDFRDCPAIESWAEGIARAMRPAPAEMATTT